MKSKWIHIALIAFMMNGCVDVDHTKFLSCGNLNLDHLGYLYEEVGLMNGRQAGVIHIYSEYPDYSYAIEPREGFTCVDDVARAVVFLSSCEAGEWIDSTAIDKLMDFILYMQSDSGYFYNFIWHDGSINRTYRTTRAVPDWWSWRAFWALESYAANRGKETPGGVTEASRKLAETIFIDLLTSDRTTKEVNGIIVPTWLPGGTAADQAGVLITALEKYYRRTGDARATHMIGQLADGIILMQAGDSTAIPYGAFLSWNNLWHAYGNMQAYALLRAGELLGREKYVNSALMEIDHFYPWLMDQAYLNYFSVEKVGDSIRLTEHARFPQIAYGFRPMIYACLEAYRITGKEKYLGMSRQIGKWFAGENLAQQPMYDRSTGRCYDAINGMQDINLNSGAESTIEALLSLQALEKEGVKIFEDD